MAAASKSEKTKKRSTARDVAFVVILCGVFLGTLLHPPPFYAWMVALVVIGEVRLVLLPSSPPGLARYCLTCVRDIAKAWCARNRLPPSS